MQISGGVQLSGGINLAPGGSSPTPDPYVFQGSNYGYASSGGNSNYSVIYNTIDKFPFTSDTNATDVGDLTVDRSGAAGQSSSTGGYTSGGFTPIIVNTIDKFPFASDGNATDVGDLTVARRQVAGQQY